jgi:predicted nucleic acid-binding protein
MTILEKLNQMKSVIEKADREQAICEGVIKQLQSDLKKQFGVTEKDIPKLQKEFENKCTVLEEKLESGIKNLEESYDWGF